MDKTEKKKKKRTFREFDLVRVAKHSDEYISGLTDDCNAIVLERSDRDYSLYIEGEGEAAWYGHDQLTLVKADQEDLLDQWRRGDRKEANKKAKLNWIFANGQDILKSANVSSIVTLGRCMIKGFSEDDLWGSNGEGMNFHQNSLTLLNEAKPFLESGDKKGWLEHCKHLKDIKSKK
jgi:hypothetical protein